MEDPIFGEQKLETGTTEENVKPSRGVKKPLNWWDRVFRSGFTIEDLILYVFTFFLAVFFAIAFSGLNSNNNTDKIPTKTLSETVLTDWKPVSSTEAGSWQNGSISLDYIRAQIIVSAMRYQQAGISSAAISTRLNMGFLVGTIVTILGCIIVIRGVRGDTVLKMAITEGKTSAPIGNFNLTTGLPGVVVVVVGGLILLTTLVASGQRPSVTDAQILWPGSGEIMVAPDTSVDPPIFDDYETSPTNNEPNTDETEIGEPD